MSTLAIWMFGGLGLLLVLMVLTVVLAGVVTRRKREILIHEVDGLRRDIDEALGSAHERRSQDI